MSTNLSSDELIATSSVAPEIFDLRPDYRALLICAEGLVPGPSDSQSEELILRAEKSVEQAIGAEGLVEELAPVAAWREAYRSFGAKPQRTRPSAEALIRRASDGLPRIDRITDTYNALSVIHMIPIGGENADKYQGPAHLIRASGLEPFETKANGVDFVEHPEVGEVIWADDLGVTCRLWNWRQSLRTRISLETTRALFILDGLTEVLSEEELLSIGEELQAALKKFSPHATFVTRLIGQK